MKDKIIRFWNRLITIFIVWQPFKKPHMPTCRCFRKVGMWPDDIPHFAFWDKGNNEASVTDWETDWRFCPECGRASIPVKK